MSSHHPNMEWGRSMSQLHLLARTSDQKAEVGATSSTSMFIVLRCQSMTATVERMIFTELKNNQIRYSEAQVFAFKNLCFDFESWQSPMICNLACFNSIFTWWRSEAPKAYVYYFNKQDWTGHQ